MDRNTDKHRQITDKQLLADAWAQLEGTSVPVARRASGARSRGFPARRRGLCHRCGRWIDRGDQVRFHKGFIGVVQSGCRPPAVTVTTVSKPTVTGKREPNITPCSECHLVHASNRR
jgi:hypothetical protein